MKTIVLLSVALVGLSGVAGWTGFSANGKSSETKSEYNVTAPSEPAPQTGPTGMSGPLRWVRGTVLSQSPSSLTLKLRDSSLTLSLDAATEIINAGNAAQPGALAIGSVVQAHYLGRHNERRAVVILDDAAQANELSKRSGTSYRGVVKTIRSAAVTIRIEGRTQGLSLDSHTTLVDRTGHVLAKGSKTITRLLSAGETLLVTYRAYSDTTLVGDVNIPNYWETALEIRRL